MAKKSGYAKMYMVTPSIWEYIKKCVSNLELQRLEQLNAEKNIQTNITPEDIILSNISQQDISPIDVSIRSRSDLGENVTQPTELMSETYSRDPSFHSTDRSRSMINPNLTTQTVYPTQEIPELTTTEYPKTLVTRPEYVTSEFNRSYPLVPITSVVPHEKTIQSSPVPRRIRKSQSVTFRKPLTIEHKKPSSISFRKPLSIEHRKPLAIEFKKSQMPVYHASRRRRRYTDDYIDPVELADSRDINLPAQYANVDYSTPSLSQSYGRLPRPDLSTTIDESDISGMSFDPRIYSTPIKGHRLPTIMEEPEQTPIPIPILPGCSPNTPKRKSKSSNIQSRSKPYNIPQTSRTRGESSTTNPESHNCPMCNKNFSKKSYMEAHLRVIHGVNKKTTTFDRWKL
jgi:hypothetical protein